MDLLRKWTRFFFIMVLSGVLLSACSNEKAYQGAGSSGTVAGVLIDSQNSWRGMIVGGSLGAALVGGVSEISTRASREAAREGKPVAYQRDDGFQRVEAHPLEKGSRPNCRLVRELIYQDGKLVRDEIREVCQ
jgi:hypothetical protein